jgi:hypothetical protein
MALFCMMRGAMETINGLLGVEVATCCSAINAQDQLVIFPVPALCRRPVLLFYFTIVTQM